MPSLTARCKALTLAVLLVTGSVALVSFESAAQQPGPEQTTRKGPNGPHRGPAIGGTSLTLSDIWGPAKMPPPANDFGPHFDYPGTYTLDGAPNHAPYPN
jgi:hypothetical protein